MARFVLIQLEFMSAFALERQNVMTVPVLASYFADTTGTMCGPQSAMGVAVESQVVRDRTIDYPHYVGYLLIVIGSLTAAKGLLGRITP